MNILDVKTTKDGFKHYDKLPADFRLATIEDFTTDGKRNIGMEFLIKWRTKEDFYQICIVSIGLFSKFIQPFIDDDRVFVKI